MGGMSKAAQKNLAIQIGLLEILGVKAANLNFLIEDKGGICCIGTSPSLVLNEYTTHMKQAHML
jgi:hypothetical protein